MCVTATATRSRGTCREECSRYVDSAWAWLEGLGTGVRRDDPRTWEPPAWPPSYRGVINTLEVAHADFVWRVRKHARVRQARRAPGLCLYRTLDTLVCLRAAGQACFGAAVLHSCPTCSYIAM